MKELKYPKTYANIVARDGPYFVAETDAGQQVRLCVGNRTGYGHSQDIQPGLRIKIYRRPGEKHLKFRFVGS